MLEYKTLGGDVLIFKGKDTLTIHRDSYGEPTICTIEIDGESFYEWEMEENSLNNPFTEDEILFFVKNYDHIVGEKY